MSEEEKNILRADYRRLMEELEVEVMERSKLLTKAQNEHDIAFSQKTSERVAYWKRRLKKTNDCINGLKRLGASLGEVLATQKPVITQQSLFNSLQ